MIRRRRPLGDAQTHAIATAAVQTSLQTAALVDPEPISKTLLTIAAGVTSLISAAFAGCGQTCVAATRVVDQVEPQLRQLRDAYLAQTTRTTTLQNQVLSLMDAIFSDVHSACSDPALGDAGKRCISERLVEGGIAPWCPTQTGCDWITIYRLPVAHDAGVQSALSPTLEQLTGAASAYGGYIAAAVILWAVFS